MDDARLLLSALGAHSGEQPWWLGYLDTGTDDVVFLDAPRVSLYAGWEYVLVLAGVDEATRWRHDPGLGRGPGPDLAFPADRSWLLSHLWDDDWRFLGASRYVVDLLLAELRLQLATVVLDEDATPAGHRAI